MLQHGAGLLGTSSRLHKFISARIATPAFLRMSPFCTCFLAGPPRGILVKVKFVFFTNYILSYTWAQQVRVQLGQLLGQLGIEHGNVGLVGFNPIAARKRLRNVDT